MTCPVCGGAGIVDTSPPGVEAAPWLATDTDELAATKRWAARLASERGDALLRAEAAEAEASNLGHECDRCEERLWRLAAMAGWRPGNPADNNATAELVVRQALERARAALADADGTDWSAP